MVPSEKRHIVYVGKLPNPSGGYELWIVCFISRRCDLGVIALTPECHLLNQGMEWTDPKSAPGFRLCRARK